ncbi:GntR family transcriptional regulator [Phyllobacterium myrsinacearum]|uniref:DNA-binding GntR family transcriptional regulator n=1 Tax=Phyllobacterium myrsinacearum TaxID=28101 RepID=A0A839ESJ7_9HYPH|nr:GntR family transcriptional regulator [Phyllobacterium myrsinacearum]MBA8879580.1 DNA-binding GntR family transcriptional regulator [Phyllobacterium myrsinacearum]
MVKPRTAADHIADRLREAIVKGLIEAGTALRQDDLASKFGISRMPVRDALRALEAEGFVSIHPTRGTFVSLIDTGEIQEIFVLRQILECAALRLAFPHITAEMLDAADRILDRIEEGADFAQWGMLNLQFHMILYRPCGNRRLLSTIEAQNNAAERYIRFLATIKDFRSRSGAEHRDIVAACREGNQTRAIERLTEHLQVGCLTLTDAVENRS